MKVLIKRVEISRRHEKYNIRIIVVIGYVSVFIWLRKNLYGLVERPMIAVLICLVFYPKKRIFQKISTLS